MGFLMAHVIYDGPHGAVDADTLGRSFVRGEPVRVSREVARQLIAQGWLAVPADGGDDSEPADVEASSDDDNDIEKEGAE